VRLPLRSLSILALLTFAMCAPAKLRAQATRRSLLLLGGEPAGPAIDSSFVRLTREAGTGPIVILPMASLNGSDIARPRAQQLEALGGRTIVLDFMRPGRPTDNGHIESFNGRLRDECPNVHQFLSLDHAKAVIEAWRLDYNTQRPHGSLGDLTPSEFAAKHQDRPTARST